MLPPPPRSTLFPYTTLFRSRKNRTTRSSRSAGEPRVTPAPPGPAGAQGAKGDTGASGPAGPQAPVSPFAPCRSEEHTSELQSHHDLVCRLLLEKKNNNTHRH